MMPKEITEKYQRFIRKSNRLYRFEHRAETQRLGKLT